MTFDELNEEFKQDTQIDKFDLGNESLRIYGLISKYFGYFWEEKKIYQSLKFKYDKLYKDRWEYYQGKATDDEIYKNDPLEKRIIKQDLSVYLNQDKPLQNAKFQMEMQEDKLALIEKAIKHIEGLNYTIKNVIDYMKFLQGAA